MQKEVAEKTMKDSIEDRTQKDVVLDTGVPYDDSWWRRGFSSINGVFAAILFENGKVLDVG